MLNCCMIACARPDVRWQGRGRFLLLTVMARAAGGGFRSMGLGCDARNVGAMALYWGLGWEDGGMLR
jgi:GNAT superfamily N-acetyltransferase